MTAEDVAAVERLTDDAFYDVARRTSPRGEPEPSRRSAERSRQWTSRLARLVATDPGGCWVAVDADGLLGAAASARRERLWLLSTFVVRPGQQGLGTGRRLLERAQAYGAGCDRGILSASDDPRALRRYHAAGFALHPQMMFRGKPDRGAIPAVTGLREGTEADREWMDALDRELRGAPHGPDHAALAEASRLLVDAGRGGYCYATPAGIHVLAAREEATATALLWACLADSGGDFEVAHVTSANGWAVDVAMRARLLMSVRGFLAVRDMPPPAPYLHSGALL